MGLFSGIWDVATAPFRLVTNAVGTAYNTVTGTVGEGLDWGASLGYYGGMAGLIAGAAYGFSTGGVGDAFAMALGGGMAGAVTGGGVGLTFGAAKGAIGNLWEGIRNPLGGSAPEIAPDVPAQAPAKSGPGIIDLATNLIAPATPSLPKPTVPTPGR